MEKTLEYKNIFLPFLLQLGVINIKIKKNITLSSEESKLFNILTDVIIVTKMFIHNKNMKIEDMGKLDELKEIINNEKTDDNINNTNNTNNMDNMNNTDDDDNDIINNNYHQSFRKNFQNHYYNNNNRDDNIDDNNNLDNINNRLWGNRSWGNVSPEMNTYNFRYNNYQTYDNYDEEQVSNEHKILYKNMLEKSLNNLNDRNNETHFNIKITKLNL